MPADLSAKWHVRVPCATGRADLETCFPKKKATPGRRISVTDTKRAQTDTHTRSQPESYSYVRTRTSHTHTHAHATHSCARTQTHARTHARARPHTRTFALTRADGSRCGVCASAIGRRYTPLHWAAREGHAAVVAALLTHGADVHAKSSGGCGGRSLFLTAVGVRRAGRGRPGRDRRNADRDGHTHAHTRTYARAHTQIHIPAYTRRWLALRWVGERDPPQAHAALLGRFPRARRRGGGAARARR